MGIRSNRGNSFFELYGEQAKLLVDAVELLTQVLQSPETERAQLRDQLHAVEHAGDDINHELINKLNQSFVTPFDREDMSEIASSMDDCLDLIDEAGDLFALYRVGEIPAGIRDYLKIQVEVLVKCAKLTAESIPGLNKPSGLRSYWVEINRLENEGDQAYRKTLSALFESGIDPVQIVKLKDIVELLERSSDAFEDLANCIESIAVKES